MAGAGVWFRNKAFELLFLGAVAVFAGWLAQTFVSQSAYAEDQKAIVEAIQNIAPALSKTLEVDRIQREIRETDQLRQRLIRYRDADPDSPLALARQQEIDVLEDQKEQLNTELAVAIAATES